MSRRLVVRPLAECDIAEAALWYDQQRAGLGAEFPQAVEEAITRAAAKPEHYRQLCRRPVVRRVLTDRFPYRVFFSATESVVVVHAVLHGARDDRVWQERL